MKFTNVKFWHSFFIPVILVLLSLLNEEEAKVIEKILREEKCTCGRDDVLSMTNNGTVVETGYKYPWSIALQKENLTICGGALITKHFAITAAHCLLKSGIAETTEDFQCLIDKRPENCFEPSENLLAGFMHKKEPTIGKRVSITRYYVHPEFVPLDKPNDIAILYLATPSDCTKYNRPICLSFREADIKPGTTVQIAGWGPDALNEDPYNEDSRPYESVLNEIKLKLWSEERCLREHNDPNTFCATGECEGACKGDSGSVAFILRPDKVYYAVGITSILLGNVCKHSMPAYFTKICSFRSWIEEIVKQDSSSE